MSWRVALLGLAAGLLGCAVYSTAPLPEIADSPAPPQRIFVVLEGAEANAGRFAAELEWAGFKPWIVQNAGEVPADAPLIEHFGYGPGTRADSCLDRSPLWMLPAVLTLGVVPGLFCDTDGYSFDVRRTPQSLVRHVDTGYGISRWGGWFVAPIALLPGWSFQYPEGWDRDRERRGLRAGVHDALGQQP